MRKRSKRKFFFAVISFMMALFLALAPGFRTSWLIKAQAEPNDDEGEFIPIDDIVITFAEGETWTALAGRTASPDNNLFHANGHSVSVEVVNDFGRTDANALKVTKIGKVESYHHWVRMGHIAEWAQPGDEQLGLPKGSTYTITAWFYVPAEAAGAKTIAGPQIFLNNNAPASFPTSADDFPVDTWTEVVFETPLVRLELDNISFKLYTENDDNYPDYWYIDDITIVHTSGEAVKLPEWDLESSSLQAAYQDYFAIGNIIMGPNQLNDEKAAQKTQAMFNHHYRALTAENHNKPSHVVNADGQYTGLDNIKKMVAYCQENDIRYIGHTLLWHSQSSRWLHGTVDEPLARSEAKKRLEDFINKVAGGNGIKGNVYSWDVVNEAFLPGVGVYSGEWRNHLRTDETEGNDASAWYAAYANGAEEDESAADFIYDAFVFARFADPNAILYYNDFNDEQRGKSMAIAAMVKELNEQWANDPRYDDRFLIEGIGLQGHYNTNISTGMIEIAIEHYIAENPGVLLSVTELDITIAGTDQSTPPTEEQYQYQAFMYAELFEIYKKYAIGPANTTANPKVIERVTFWGTNDADSWRSFGQNGGTGGYPTLFDAAFEPKQAFYAVINSSEYIENYQAAGIVELQEAEAVFTAEAPTMDGKSPHWDLASPIEISKRAIGESDVTAAARILWDRENLYIRVEVIDREIDLTSANAWEKDSVELYISESDYRGSYSAAQGQQYRLDAAGGKTQKEDSYPAWVGYAEETSSGYLVEFSIPWHDGHTTGDVIGLDIQINDPPPGASNRPQVTWNDPLANGYNTSENWGRIKLVGEMVTSVIPEEMEDVAEIPEEVEEAAEDEKSNLSGVWMGILLVAAGGVVLGIAIVRKRKRSE